jgi:hypothetical protein
MNQHQFYTEAIEQCDIVNDIGKIVIGDRFAAKRQHHGAAAMGIDVRRGIAEGFNVIECAHSFHRWEIMG